MRGNSLVAMANLPYQASGIFVRQGCPTGSPTRCSSAYPWYSGGSRIGASSADAPNRSHRPSYSSKVRIWTRLRSGPTFLLPAGTPGSVYQCWCPIHAAAATCARGMTKPRSGREWSSGTATITNHSRSCFGACCDFSPSGQLDRGLSPRIDFTCTSMSRRSLPVWTAKMSVRSRPSLVSAGAHPLRASSEAAQCSPIVFVCFVSAMIASVVGATRRIQLRRMPPVRTSLMTQGCVSHCGA